MFMKNNQKHRLITIGEIMLRLSTPYYGKLRAVASLEMNYGGSEANVALSLANLGVDASYFTVVPDNSLGRSAIRSLKSCDVDCSKVIYSTPKETPTHRLGIYYLEPGFGIRPSEVIYDRKHSAFSEYDFSKIDLEKILDGCTWLHLSGVTPALGTGCQELTMSCLKIASEKHMTVSFDGNFRSGLWGWESARDFCTRCLPYINVLFGTEPYHLWKNAEKPEEGDLKDSLCTETNIVQEEMIFKAFASAYPNIRCIARHVRESHNSSKNSLSAYLWTGGKTVRSNRLTFDILDRVGGGDAFIAGIIYGLMNEYSPEETVNFGVAASALKHTIHGDGNITDNVDTIRQVMQMNFDIKR